MNLLQEHILITTSSFFLIMSTYVTNYLTFFSIILFLTSILKSISNNPSRKYEYMTTSILSIIFFYSGIEIAYNNNYNLFQIKLYFMSLCYFHFMEYIFCLIYHPKKLNFDSKILNKNLKF